MHKLGMLCVLGLASAGAADFNYGPIGITSIENLRLAAFCLPGDVRTQGACQIEFHFHDRTGQVVRETAMTLAADTGGTLDFRLPDGVAARRRGETIPCIRVISGAVASNIQVFDVFTNRTRIFRNYGDRPAALGGEIHFGHTGVTGNDTARIGALCEGGLSSEAAAAICEVTFIFHDNQGKVLKQATATMRSGESSFLSFRTTEAGLPARRGEIVPCVRVARGAAVTSLEVFDTLSGLTLVSTHAAATLAP